MKRLIQQQIFNKNMNLKELSNIKIKKWQVYFGITAIILITTIIYSIIKYNELSYKTEVIAENQNTILTLKTNLEDKKNSYFNIKKEHDGDEVLIASAMKKIFPEEADQNNLLREIETFFAKNHLSTNASLLSSISFSGSSSTEGSLYQTLPLSMSIECSESNFYKFLEFIETSGSLENEIRLMALDNISLNFGEDTTTNFSFSVNANAYFQKPAETAPSEVTVEAAPTT
jgi:Tfp pilus assembly protein PilO